MRPSAPGLSADMCMGVREEGWVGDCVHILGQMSWYLCSGLGDGCAGCMVLSAGEPAVCTGCMEGLQGCEVQLCALLVQHVCVSQVQTPWGSGETGPSVCPTRSCWVICPPSLDLECPAHREVSAEGCVRLPQLHQSVL